MNERYCFLCVYVLSSWSFREANHKIGEQERRFTKTRVAIAL